MSIITGTILLYSAKRSFTATYKAGKAAMESGSGYSKFMLCLIKSIIVSLPILGKAISGLGTIVNSMTGNAGTSAVETNINKDAGNRGVRQGKAMDQDTSNSHEYKDEIKLENGQVAKRIYNDGYANAEGKIAYKVNTPDGGARIAYLDGTDFKHSLAKQIETQTSPINVQGTDF